MVCQDQHCSLRGNSKKDQTVANCRVGTLANFASSCVGSKVPGSGATPETGNQGAWKEPSFSKDCDAVHLEENIADLIAEIFYLHFILF